MFLFSLLGVADICIASGIDSCTTLIVWARHCRGHNMCCTSYRYLMLFVLAGTSALYYFNWDHLFENPAKNDTSSEVGDFHLQDAGMEAMWKFLFSPVIQGNVDGKLHTFRVRGYCR